MEQDKNGGESFLSIDRFISELIGYHEQIKKLQASEVQYRLLATTLQESLDKYQAVFDHLPQKVFLKDEKSRYLLANENYARSLGVPRQEVSGKTDHDFFPPETAEQLLEDDREVMARGVPAEKEGRYTREGRVEVERILKAPVKNSSGDTVGVLGISWDITDQKTREEELEKRSAEVSRLLEARTEELREIQGKSRDEEGQSRQLEEKVKNLEGLYWLLFENTGTAVAVIEDNQGISRVNREFEKISGYSRAEVEGAKNWNEFIHNGRSENAGEAIPPPDLNSLDAGTRVFNFFDRQNVKKTISMTAVRIPDTNKVMVSLTDITRYKETREELNRVVGQFKELVAEMEKGVKNLDE
jgi:PAS domain S-box-containing protein